MLYIFFVTSILTYIPGTVYYNLDLPYGVDHLESHVDAVVGMVGPRHGEAGNAVVTIAEDFDPHALVVLHRKQCIEGRKRLMDINRVVTANKCEAESSL